MMFVGAVPTWISGLAISGVVLFYIFLGGLRGAAWANAFQTCVFMVTGIVAFALISNRLGGLDAATAAVAANAPGHLVREGRIGHLQFLSYMLVPLSVGMFPHLFQHWLTARSAKSFRLSVIAHPIFIMIVWLPCILMGVWALGAGIKPPGGNASAILPAMVDTLLHSPFVSGLLMAGVLAAIMSSLDSQFVCLGSMFTHDVVVHHYGEKRFTDSQRVLIGRSFIVAIVTITFLLSLVTTPRIFTLGVWCFSGFASLFPLVLASLYWRRVTRAGAIASVLVMFLTWCYFFYEGMIRPMRAGTATTENYLVGGLMPVTYIFAASALTLIVVSLVTKPPPAALVESFVTRRSSAFQQ
jgi:SSS family solute:Na+ symporter